MIRVVVLWDVIPCDLVDVHVSGELADCI